MPRPPGGRVTETKTVAHGMVVEVTVPSSLRQQVVFAEKALPKAGFTLARGDAEADEADIPFRKGSVSGQLRIRAGGACRATWILTVLHG